MNSPAETTASVLEQERRNAAALELIHASGGHVVTKLDPHMVERDWDAEAYLDVWAGQYARNIAENYHLILRGRTIKDLHNALAKGHPQAAGFAAQGDILPRYGAAAVVGAGPSLDKNAELLRDFPGLVIACDRAAKALTARGIKPDLVVCVDPRPAVMAEMLNYPENREQRLALSVLADPEVARVWRGQIHYMTTLHPGTQFFDRILPELFPGMPGTEACGNVGNTAVQLAEWMGAEKIVLVGQDYSYPGGRMHCDDWVRFPRGSWRRVERDEAADAALLERRTGKLEVDGVQTYDALASYRNTLQRLVEDWELDVVNATEGGILNFLPQTTLQAAIDALRAQKYSADEGHALLASATGGVQ